MLTLNIGDLHHTDFVLLKIERQLIIKIHYYGLANAFNGPTSYISYGNLPISLNIYNYKINRYETLCVIGVS
jgi:hypothetical protein